MNMTISVTKKDRVIFWFYGSLKKIESKVLALSSGFLLGRIVHEVSVPYRDFFGIILGLFSVSDRPANYLTWLSVVLLGVIPLLSYIFTRLYRRRQYDRVFASLVQKHKAPSIARFNAMSWGSALSLQTCPELHRGWSVSQVKLDHNPKRFSMPKEYVQAYQDYFKKYYKKKRFFDDTKKIMLTQNPIAFSDSPTLRLETQETLYSQTLFYLDNVAVLTSKRDELISKLLDELRVLFPHTLCLHAVVVTKDDKVLITKRSPKVAYFPGTWSCSVEEQLSIEDIRNGTPDTVMLKWFERLLQEELGLCSETYNKDNLRILSVFLESDVLNISICGHAILDINSAELNRIIEGLPRTDYEFSEWRFITHRELLNELFHPTRLYHPTSGYRMLMALIRRYGEPKVASEFFSR
jgi:isopentenyldiphosphate isomerase